MKDEQAPPSPRGSRPSPTTYIDRIQDLDLASITRNDLVQQFETGRAIAHGTGREKTYTYRHGVQTRLGDLERSVWIAAAEHVIKRDGLTEEAEHLQEFFGGSKSASKWMLKSKSSVILDYCISGLYQNPACVGFVPYNMLYHPETLEKAHLVRVSSECCREPGYVTEEQITRSCDGRVACPICGRASNYKRLS